MAIIGSFYKWGNKEEYKSPTAVPPNYTKYNTELTTIANDPSGEPLAYDPSKYNYNYTQLYYVFLVQLFKSLSEKKKNYNKKLVKYYAKNTVDYHAMDALDKIVKPFMEKIAILSKGRTDFWQVGYESWKVFQVENSPLKINEIDFFVYDRINWTEVRLLAQIIEMPTKDAIGKYDCRYVADKKLHTCASMTTPEFPTYPGNGIPSDDQLIPLPTEVITVGKNVENYNGVDFPVPCGFEKLWVNWVEIANSNLVLNGFEEYKDKQLPGINRIPFDYTKYTPPGPNEKQNPYQDYARATNQWPELEDKPKDVNAWPCETRPYTWNSQGVQKPVKPTRRCPGVRKGLQQEPLTASYYSGYFDIPRKITKYKWMFDNTQIIPALQYEGY